tara:strand:+ start:1753 stop:3027 length:1275 start_codon:yes stop_codon:yes gene_type:complete
MADWSEFSDPTGAMATFHRVIVKSFERNVYGDGYSKDEFRARILSTPILMDQTVGAQDEGRYKFFARITGRHSPHDELIDDPCDPIYIANRQLAEELIQMHTEFRSKGITEKPEKGDEVIIRLHRRSNGLDGEVYDLTIGEYIKPAIPLEALSSNYGPSSGNTVSAEECAALSDSFAGGVVDCPNCKQDPPNTPAGWKGAAQTDVSPSTCWDKMRKCKGKSTRCRGCHSGTKRGCIKTGYKTFPKNVQQMDIRAQPFFNMFLSFLISQGYYWEINSTRRSVKHQWNLWSGRAAGLLAGSPCFSNHNHGFAIDMNIIDATGSDITRRAGLMRQLQDQFNQTLGPTSGTGGKIEWYGSKDRVHWDCRYTLQGLKASDLVKVEKQKCYDYYYTKGSAAGTDKAAGTDAASPCLWDETFTDVLITDIP